MFCALVGSGRVLVENELAWIADTDPVSEGHSVVIPGGMWRMGWRCIHRSERVGATPESEAGTAEHLGRHDLQLECGAGLRRGIGRNGVSCISALCSKARGGLRRDAGWGAARDCGESVIHGSPAQPRHQRDKPTCVRRRALPMEGQPEAELSPGVCQRLNVYSPQATLTGLPICAATTTRRY